MKKGGATACAATPPNALKTPSMWLSEGVTVLYL